MQDLLLAGSRQLIYLNVILFQKQLESQGFIYKGTYEGWYSTSDEAFLTADQVTTAASDSNGNTTQVSNHVFV